MAFVPTENTAKVQMIYRWQGQVCVNSLFYAGMGLDDPDILLKLATNAYDQWALGLRALQNVSCELTMVRATDMSSQEGPSIEYTTPEPNTGTLSGENLPANNALVISLRTAGRGRASRGRIYLPGMNTQQVTDSTWDGGVITSALAAMDYFAFLDIEGNPYGLMVVSFTLNGVPRGAGRAIQVSSFVVNPVVGSQRRRLPGRGT